MLTACFTGVESTPKITSSDVKREKVTVSEEQRYLADIRGEQLSAWTPGKELYVTDNKLASLLTPPNANGEYLRGKTLMYQGAENVTSITGEQVAELTFLTPQGRVVKYRSDASIEAINQRASVNLPFTIEMSVIQEVRQRLQGEEYYVVTAVWYDENDQSFFARKFVPVKVISVEPGNSVYPVKLTLLEENGIPFHLFMNVGDKSATTRDFASLFSFSDPHKRYPLISDATWKNIINCRVVADMTRDECRLALGSPAEIERRPSPNMLREIWSYENGMYLIFEDGILRRYGRRERGGK